MGGLNDTPRFHTGEWNATGRFFRQMLVAGAIPDSRHSRRPECRAQKMINKIRRLRP